MSDSSSKANGSNQIGADRSALLPAAWDPAAVEENLYQGWVDSGYFKADPASDKPPFSIVLPPPNVTGQLHMGHALDHTLMDAMARRKRMQGFEVLWLPGSDHAGIATQTKVEANLKETEGKDRFDYGREAFVDKVWEWKDQYGGVIQRQMRAIGDSVDWSRERFTLDDGLSRAVQTMFKELFDAGLIYRANRMVNWSPVLQTAISDIEVVYSDDEGELVSIRYGSLDDSEPHVIVATTRVETMLGDVAVAVHPEDERYADLVGKTLPHPFLPDRQMVVVADDYVDPEFGTGAVKITPAHDPNDFALGQRHDLPMPVIMDETGHIANTGTEFDGMERYEAREKIRLALEEQGRIVARKFPYVHSVGHSERSKEAVEPRLSEQWFVKVDELAKMSGDAIRSGDSVIHPSSQEPRWFDWVDDMHDWCISRQLWWGHRIPIWYGPNGEIVCCGPDDEPPTGEGWRQDEDVLDTWFSSALWPFSTMGWPEKTPELEKFYPTSVLVTGYDILFMNGAHVGELPAREALTDADRWILDRLEEVRQLVDDALDRYEFSLANENLYRFAWGEFCDWYLEIAKVQIPRDWDSATEEQIQRGISTQIVLGRVLDAVLRLLHPAMPFVTETLWKALTAGEEGYAESLVTADWPTADLTNGGVETDADAVRRMADVDKLVTELRRFRSDQGVKPSQKVPAALDFAAADLADFEDAVRSLVRLETPAEDFAETASIEVRLSQATIAVQLDTSGTVDVAAERKRLEKDLAAAQKELDNAAKKLGNENFLAKAPEKVVEGIRGRQRVAQEEFDRITARLEGLPKA